MQRTVGKYTLGIVLVALGLMVALETFGTGSFLRDGFLKWWPLAIVVLGLEYILVSRDPETKVRISGGAVFLILLALGCAWIYQAGYKWSDIIQIDRSSGRLIAANREAYALEIPVDEAFGPFTSATSTAQQTQLRGPR
ncbi:MAG TPA: hypothetical protein GX500_05775 [Firmicutes bacterium]|nr:hypothetical protein [Candidatus Fermentithermobacillaceae bacterium]